MKIIGIETSCDETAVSIVEAQGNLDELKFRALGSAVNSQIDIHRQYGGVFPTLAKREHQKNLPAVYAEALESSGINESEIELIAVTVGPGLEPALWTGIAFAEELSKRLGKPVVPANHMLGHIASVLFTESSNLPAPRLRGQEAGPSALSFPALALLISGGHTELVLLKNWGEKEKIGQTLDDAVGEAFDKVARMMGLPYPGGPEISRLATQARESSIMNYELRLPRPMLKSGDLNFSFSGLKTAVLYHIRKKEELGEKEKMEIAREFEDAVIETLLSKTKRAIDIHSPKTLVIGGGVIANKALRESFLKFKDIYPELEILIPERSLTTDNATMIAAAGYIEYLKSGSAQRELVANGNLSLG